MYSDGEQFCVSQLVRRGWSWTTYSRTLNLGEKENEKKRTRFVAKYPGEAKSSGKPIVKTFDKWRQM